MRQIDNMTPSEIETLHLKGMLGSKPNPESTTKMKTQVTDSEKLGPRTDAIRSLLKHALDDMDKLAEALADMMEAFRRIGSQQDYDTWSLELHQSEEALAAYEKARQQ